MAEMVILIITNMSVYLVGDYVIRNVQLVHRNAPRCISFLLMTLFILSVNKAFCEPFAISGTIKTSLVSMDKSSDKKWKFTVIIDDCRFIVNTEDISLDSSQTAPIQSPNLPPLPKGAKITKTVKWSWAYDGADTYIAFGTTNGWSSAEILSGLNIQTSASYQEILWLAFASRCYLSSLTNSTMQPLWPLDDPSLEKTNYRMPVIIRTFNDQLGLLKNLVYLNDGLYRGYDSNRGSYVEPLAAPYLNGYTNADYEVQQITNLPAGILPLDSVFFRYVVPLGYSGSIIPVSKTEVLVDSVEEANGNHAFHPSVGQIFVTDFRLAGSVPIAGDTKVPYDYIRYQIKDGQWLSDSQKSDVRQQYEADVENQFSKEKKAIVADAHNKTKRSIASLIILGFILCSATVTVIMIRVLHKKRRK
jgi:hypothetical protein